MRRQLEVRGIELEKCSFRLVAHGPILEESNVREDYDARREKIGAMEKALAEAMCGAGYEVLNTIHCKKPLDHAAFAEVRHAFGEKFPKLGRKAAMGA